VECANSGFAAIERRAWGGNVLLAAISILDHIRLLGYGDLADEMDALGVPRTEWEQVRIDGAPIDDCGLIRDWR